MRQIMIEVEIKVRISNIEKLKDTLISMGFECIGMVREEDVYFDDKNGSIRLNDQALRLRKTSDGTSQKEKVEITYKGKKLEETAMTRQELETEVKDFECMKQILSGLGFFPVEPKVIKNRIQYEKDKMHACLDEVENLGSFLELELLVEDASQKDDALMQLGDVLYQLGYDRKDTTRVSYLTQLQQK